MPKRGSNSTKTASSTKTLTTWKQLTDVVRHPQETLILCIASALDVAMTIYLLNRSDVHFTESNPFARYFLDRWGLAGMGYFKAVVTIIVVLITQFVARKNADLARQVLGLATVIIVAVVVYSVWLHFKHHHIVEVIEAQRPGGIWN